MKIGNKIKVLLVKTENNFILLILINFQLYGKSFKKKIPI